MARIVVESGDVYGYLEAKWPCDSQKDDPIWKCLCQRCGRPCYVRERGLLLGLVEDCGCKTKEPHIHASAKQKQYKQEQL